MSRHLHWSGPTRAASPWTGRMHAASPWKGLVAGLAAGVVGTLVMTWFQQLASQATSSQDDADERAANAEFETPEKAEQSGDEPATQQAARQLAHVALGRELMPSEAQAGGQLVHYGFGTLNGAAYGVLAELAPAATAGSGALFGGALMVLADEVVVPMLGWSEPPAKQSASDHAYALAAHLVYGVTTEMTRRAVRSML